MVDIQGFIFDLDGVITDTAEQHYLSWKQLAEEENLPFTREDNEALRGRSRRESLEILLKGTVFPETKLAEFMERKNNYFHELLQNITPSDTLPGVLPFLQVAKANNIQLGLASASRNAKIVCEQLGIISMFDVIGDGSSIVNAKPAPDIFIWVAGGMGLNPGQCVVFEDAEAGVEAALRGGFWSVGIGPAERVKKAHHIVSGLYEFTSIQQLFDFVNGTK